MANPAFDVGDDVLVLSGEFKGRYGHVVAYEDTFDKYMVILPEVHATGFWPFYASELELMADIDETTPAEPDTEAPKIDEIEVPSFGMTTEEFGIHAEYLMVRSLERITSTGPDEAFFGYQEFEGMNPKEILGALMVKVEESLALFAQAHILIGRTALALEKLHDQDK